jgi:hypothetical protein
LGYVRALGLAQASGDHRRHLRRRPHRSICTRARLRLVSSRRAVAGAWLPVRGGVSVGRGRRRGRAQASA